MASFNSHVNIVRKNHILLQATLIPKIELHPDWTAVVAFYSALHMVEAAFYYCHPQQHFDLHTKRNEELKRTEYSHIWKHYRPLYSASRLARYLDPGPHGGDCAVFNIPPRKVKERLIDFELRQIQFHTQELIRKSAGGFSFRYRIHPMIRNRSE